MSLNHRSLPVANFAVSNPVRLRHTCGLLLPVTKHLPTSKDSVLRPAILAHPQPRLSYGGLTQDFAHRAHVLHESFPHKICAARPCPPSGDVPNLSGHRLSPRRKPIFCGESGRYPRFLYRMRVRICSGHAALSQSPHRPYGWHCCPAESNRSLTIKILPTVGILMVPPQHLRCRLNPFFIVKICVTDPTERPKNRFVCSLSGSCKGYGPTE